MGRGHDEIGYRLLRRMQLLEGRPGSWCVVIGQGAGEHRLLRWQVYAFGLSGGVSDKNIPLAARGIDEGGDEARRVAGRHERPFELLPTHLTACLAEANTPG